MLTPLPLPFRAAPLLFAGLLLLSGCAGLDAGREMLSGLSDSIFGEDDSADPPAALQEYQAEVQIDVLWKESVGDGADKQYLKLIPSVQSDRIYAADRKGSLQARNLANGDLVWGTNTDFAFSAGPGLGRRVVVMGCTSGEVIAFDIGTGEQLWLTNVPSEVQAVPVIAKDVVIVRTTDGKVIGLREADGAQLWVSESSVPALSIRGAGAPIVIDNAAIVGSANGKMQALQLNDGKSLWEATIAMPTGRSEVERLVDLDVDPLHNRGAIFVSSFNGGTSSVSEVDGDIIWRNPEISSYTGISADYRYLYISDTKSEVSQLDQRNGASLWKQKDLHNRQLTAAVVYDNYVVVGDFEGWVHWLSVSDGRQLGRIQVANSPIEAKPVIVDGTVYIYAKNGTLAALRAR
ncbi:outer membrane protein assembly factor BamB [Methylomonas sp. SURF-2]|uniref:Outer membrane protein assembly factor BamB n=1 Tax=Methylomonas subterranea TaxID=2952225 RepID=A0ABT1TH39_9GAMM|nr:outer membrane protein assembly factor BamB [Methylomonas sp. SURF-2]MCQ8104768.1 outer membrane protein assembly factor BamB [Methylomonas sp. SURF-2]